MTYIEVNGKRHEMREDNILNRMETFTKGYLDVFLDNKWRGRLWCHWRPWNGINLLPFNFNKVKFETIIIYWVGEGIGIKLTSI